jgi:oxaloacetate decarboxylase alpha subunit
VKDKILNRPRAKELMSEPPQPSVAELRKRFGPSMSDEEMLLRAVMPEDQVDAMLAAGPAKRGYNPDARGIAELVRELTKRPAASELTVEKPGMKVTLRSTASA